MKFILELLITTIFATIVAGSLLFILRTFVNFLYHVIHERDKRKKCKQCKHYPCNRVVFDAAESPHKGCKRFRRK